MEVVRLDLRVSRVEITGVWEDRVVLVGVCDFYAGPGGRVSVCLSPRYRLSLQAAVYFFHGHGGSFG